MFNFIENWQEKREFKKLVRACLGNKEKATRLMGYEICRNRYITKREAIDLAFERLEIDRSR